MLGAFGFGIVLSSMGHAGLSSALLEFRAERRVTVWLDSGTRSR